MVIYWVKHQGTIMQKTRAITVASKDVSLEVHAAQGEYNIHMSFSERRTKSYCKGADNTFENVRNFVYWGTTRSNQNFIQYLMKLLLKNELRKIRGKMVKKSQLDATVTVY